jgi:hypothetical protein
MWIGLNIYNNEDSKMKLQELGAPRKTEQTAKVFESYFGQQVDFGSISNGQARYMLTKVRGLLAEQRRQPGFHHSEQNPAYLKLVMMEHGLAARLREAQRRSLQESEIQQAQVVLAAQDMVDQMQKMIEQVTALQFKDLPALVEQIKNEVGVEQSAQFNNDATAALSGLVQNLQGSKQQLEGAVNVVTGQAPAPMPGQAAQGAEMGAELAAGMEPVAAPDTETTDLEASLTAEPTKGALGRAKR